MVLNAGSRLGSYEILSAVGAGGMGEVYRARDTRLDRDVAIKILPDPFALDAERVARFVREAKTLAALNHPHIAQIYGLEESNGVSALVMELVDGETLADRIARGPLPIDDALGIARQIAEALEAAHEIGIIHRDLKPANIKVRDDGTVKVLDFGLAKALDPRSAGLPGERPDAVTNSPTITSPAAMTHQGVILGTAAYMAPEQAKGRAVDRRADIWAFGCVLYEMLTGRRAFHGEDVSETLAKILERDPDFGCLPADAAAGIRRLLRRCLEKDRRKRLSSIGDARLEIDDALTPDIAAADGPRARGSGSWPARPGIAAAALVAGTLVGGVAMWQPPRAAPQQVVRFAISPGAGETLTISPKAPDVAISPDGRRVAYVAFEKDNRHLEVRALDQLTPARLSVSGDIAAPFFSPDGEWIGFADLRDGALKKVSVRGGAAMTICPLQATGPPESRAAIGAAWSSTETIVFSTPGISGGLWQVAAGGGEAKRLTTPDAARGEREHVLPSFLPDGRHVVFTVIGTPADRTSVEVLQLANGHRTPVLQGGSSARFISTGHLVYGTQGSLRAVGFDPVRLAVLSAPVPLIEDVLTKASGSVAFDVDSNGSLVYVSGGLMTAGRTLFWVDRAGRPQRVPAPLHKFHVPRISPDGQRVAVQTEDDGEIWILDLIRGTSMRLTFDPAFDGMPLWTPDGRRIVFRSGRDGGGVFSVAADGTGDVTPVTSEPVTQSPMAWSRDRKLLLMVGHGGDRSDVNAVAVTGRTDIGIVATDGAGTVTWLLRNRFKQSRPAISPDGRWMAYDSDETGQNEVYVRPFPNINEGRWQVSVDGGEGPIWSQDGRELFYARRPNNSAASGEGLTMVRVAVALAAGFSAGKPEALFQGPYISGGGNDHRMYDLAPDGRFLMVSTQSDPSTQVIVVEHWLEELKARVAEGR